MRRLLFTAALALLATGGSALPARAADAPPRGAPAAGAETFDPALLEKGHGLVDLVLPPAERDRMFERIMNATMSNMVAGMMDGQTGLREVMDKNPRVRAEFMAFIDRQRQLALEDLRDATPALVDAYARFYARSFTAGELDEIIAFVRTPTGAKYLSRSTEIMTDPDFAAWQRQITARQQSRMEPEIRTLLEKITPLLQTDGTDHHDS